MTPEAANAIAHRVGVGRGADLVMYCFIVLMLAAVFNIHLRLRSENQRLTELARAIAVMNPKQPTGE